MHVIKRRELPMYIHADYMRNNAGLTESITDWVAS